jgi:hypothetical protein
MFLLISPFFFLNQEECIFSPGPFLSLGLKLTWNLINRMVIAYVCCGVGGLGMCLLWVRWSHNYVWLLGNIFIPGMLNGLSGVLSTFVGIYATQSGRYGPSSIATLAVTGACTVFCAFLTTIYTFWKLNAVKKKHVRETEEMRKVGSEVGEVQSPK